jgi:phage head maturation protease
MPVMEERVLKVGTLYRDFTVRRADVDTTKRTVALSFSSETEEVERWFGVEILDHSPGAVDLKRLKRSGALLIDHDPTNQVGVIEEVTIGADRKGHARVRFGRSAKAEEIFQDVIDEIRTNVSCGYDPIEMKLERTQENGPDVYRVTKWMPFEISLVSIPADINVGVGRGAGQEREITVVVPAEKPKGEKRTMEKCTVCGAELADGACPECARKATATQKRETDLPSRTRWTWRRTGAGPSRTCARRTTWARTTATCGSARASRWRRWPTTS